MLKLRTKTLLSKLTWLIIPAVLFWSLSFAGKQSAKLQCNGLRVELLPKQDKASFLNEAKILTLANVPAGEILTQTDVNNLDVKAMESALQNNPYIKDAQVYLDINGKLNIRVAQNMPLIRVFKNNNSGYYITEDGFKMPLSNEYSARVIVASGNITESYTPGNDSLTTQVLKELYDLVKLIIRDPFLREMIDQIVVSRKKEFMLIPKLGNQKILFGNYQHADYKLERLKLFYFKAIPQVGWKKYQVINLKYNGKIVCEKSNETE